ncbi:hypothetical protein [Paractinoplanes brasiliensis]|uniref:Uncharacterized protein n=1 Tax=Paractinoplanes brasiliensis TaxID=52695 RepID=A0A4R6J7W3_9ACTN|nr:hypothetical protein [Actinoplanes brasiliensis]TDO31619.1 hypothetical protein C8E87_7045 [Actinoplanes brasiliensis]GID30789.1 hypothetical protein Abr02nite_57720 [Actinoplanes brasiliensis]
MSNGDRRVVVYGTGTSEFGASLRAEFPECAVDVIDRPGPPEFVRRPVLADVVKSADWLSPECIYVMLGWLGGTVGQQIVQAGVEAVITATRK